MGPTFRGDPVLGDARLLDRAQNDSVRDHYLYLEFRPLLTSCFIATSNVLDNRPGSLLDRIETIELAVLHAEEKKQIGRRYLVGRQLAGNGLKPSHIEVSEAALATI